MRVAWMVNKKCLQRLLGERWQLLKEERLAQPAGLPAMVANAAVENILQMKEERPRGARPGPDGTMAP